MQEWEYMQDDVNWPKVAGEVMDLPARWDALEIGRNGWELVSTVRTPSGTVSSLFKRLKAELRTGVSAPPSELRAGVPTLPSAAKADEKVATATKPRKGGKT